MSIHTTMRKLLAFCNSPYTLLLAIIFNIFYWPHALAAGYYSEPVLWVLAIVVVIGAVAISIVDLQARPK